MENIILLLLLSSLCFTGIDAVECESGWTAYKDEACIKLFSDVVTFDEAKAFCISKSIEGSEASMVMAKNSVIQELLANLTENIYENVWLGGRYDEESAQFQWEDGETLTYTNWGDGYPKNISNSEICIQLRPVNAKAYDINGKWENTVCQRRNLVMCQRRLSWTLQDAIREILVLRKQLEDVDSRVDAVDLKLITVNSSVNTVATWVTPIGSIYIEYNGQWSPRTLWPAFTWQDVTATYAGLFFRALGGASSSWGLTQQGCAPRISEIEYSASQTVQGQDRISIPASGWSENGLAGAYFTQGTRLYEGLRYNVSGCEVRPPNQAIRIWKRTV